MARTRRSPKKLRVAKSPRTARAAPTAPTRKLAGRESKTARPALRTYDATTARQVGTAKKAWEQGEVAKSLARAPERRTEFTTDSGIPLPAVLTPADRAREDARELGLPGQFPYTRGVQPTMYRGRLWTMRMFAGFGSPADTNQRFKYLMAHGTTGLSTAFDMPALMGYDADHSMSRGEVGKEGVAISTLRDFEILFDGIPLDQVSTSMTINASAIVALCMYIAVAEKQGVPMEKLGGTIQNDMLKEYIAQKEWIVPPRPAVRIVVDMIDFCSRHMPRWHPVSISGYHIREAGATAVQELAFTLADGIGYVEECVKRGLAVDDFAARLSFFWDVHNDFFEEIAKFRAARRLWARLMKDRFGAKKAESMKLRTHAQTAGVAPPRSSRTTTWVGPRSRRSPRSSAAPSHCNTNRSTRPTLPIERSVTPRPGRSSSSPTSRVDRGSTPWGELPRQYPPTMEKRALAASAGSTDGRHHPAVEEGYPRRRLA
jgi:methylmalonyl-CoA mutase N-terminal domain/subunit